jgi:hypothetical protein
MRRRAVSATLALVVALAAVTPALGHEGGHAGGCEDFGHVNRQVAQDPGAFGVPEARNLGDVVSGLATTADGHPGVGDVVRDVDHAACGPE